MLETTITIVATILSLEGGIARLDAATELLRSGDRGVVYHVETGSGPARWTEVGSGTAVAIGDQLALAFTVDQSVLAAGDRVLFEVPAERLRDAAAPSVRTPAADTRRAPEAELTFEPLPPPPPARASPSIQVDIEPAGGGDPAAAPEVPLSDGITSRVRAWAAAWAGQRVDEYLSFYADSFVPPDGTSRAAWEAERRRRIERPRTIDIELSELDVAVTGPDSALATFVQRYRSERFADVVEKRLDLVWERDDWHIAAERVVDP